MMRLEALAHKLTQKWLGKLSQSVKIDGHDALAVKI